MDTPISEAHHLSNSWEIYHHSHYYNLELESTDLTNEVAVLQNWLC